MNRKYEADFAKTSLDALVFLLESVTEPVREEFFARQDRDYEILLKKEVEP